MRRAGSHRESALRRGAAALALCASLFTPVACAPRDRRPNVVLIVVDTLRADYLGSYGFGFDTSPNIDRLAGQGIVFERAVAAASLTAPSVTSILTSRYTREHSVGYRNGLSKLEDATTLAELFRAGGYATGAFVSNSVLHRIRGLDRGFDVYDDDLPTPEGNRGFTYERTADATTARALAWLEGLERDPFFLWVHYQDPHGPYTAPAAYRGRFPVAPRPGERPLPRRRDDRGNRGIPAYQALEGLSRPSEYEARYAEEIAYADHSIGALIAVVDAHPSGREAVILLTADHGESLGENGFYFVHGFTTTPEVAHVPMILRAPGLAPERRREIVHHVDVLPTLLELAALEVPAEARGIAVGPIVRGRRDLPDRFVYCDIGFELTAYRGDSLVSVQGVQGAWNDDGRDAEVLRSLGYLWSPGGGWSLDARATSVPEPVKAYLRRATPIAAVAPREPYYRERLRALGYAEE